MNEQTNQNDGVDRRGFLKCMAWVGTGVVWSMSGGGILTSSAFGAEPGGATTEAAREAFSFVQISDSHIGFNKPVNADVTGTLKLTIDRINAMKKRPEMILHTGDLTHLSKPGEFDTVQQLLRGANAGETFYVPGEHDVFGDDGKLYRERFAIARGAANQNPWYSFDLKGVHFVGLVNVMNLQQNGLGKLGDDQLEWLEKDLADRTASTPVVVFAHVPLWSIYPQWGWGTLDSERALSYLKRFSAVTVLNGHIHQVLQKVEGNITFHTARSTAFPQPEPGKADSPGPLKNVPAGMLKKMLGLTSVNYTENNGPLAIVDSTLE